MAMAPLLLPALLALLAASAVSALPDFCPSITGCECGLTPSEYEIDCPITGDMSRLKVRVRPPLSASDNDSYIKIECFAPSGLPQVPRLPLAKVHFVRAYLCEMPSQQSLAEVFLRPAGLLENPEAFSVEYGRGQLSRRALEGLEGLQGLYVQSTAVATGAEEDVFDGMRSLKEFSLRESGVRVTPRLLRELHGLEHLELGMNDLSAAFPGLVANMPNLTSLNVWKAQLTTLPEDAFNGSSALVALDASQNELRTLPAKLFSRTPALAGLNLHSNPLETLPPHLFAGLRDLEKIHLENTQLEQLPERLFADLPALREVYLQHSRLKALPDDLFTSSDQLQILDLEDNYLEHIPDGLLASKAALRLLNLRDNYIGHIGHSVFASLRSLRKLDLGDNRIRDLDEASFRSSSALEELNLGSNQLRQLNSEVFRGLGRLISLDLSSNQLSFEKDIVKDAFVGWVSPLLHLTSVQRINLRNNSIKSIFADWRNTFTQLLYLDLSYNKISALNAEDLWFLAERLTLDLQANIIESIQLSGLELLAGHGDQGYIKALLEDNPLACDCRIFDVLQYLNNRLEPQVRASVELLLGKAACASPPDLAGVQVSSIAPEEFLCNTTTDRCPGECSCLLRPADRYLLADCSGRGLMRPPDLGQPRPGLKYALDLSGNRIKALEMPPGYEVVTHLDVSDNQLASIAGVPALVQVLQLHDNNLTTLAKETMQSLRNATSLKNLTMHGNPWRCDCEEGAELVDFVQRMSRVISNSSQTRCSGPSGRPLRSLSRGELCPSATTAVVASGLCLALLLLGAAVLAALYYKHEKAVKVWLYAQSWCRRLVTEDDLDADKPYDAFVSYSHKDEEFVTEHLVPRLEAQGFRLCLHYRDWTAGDFIPSQIARSVEESKRTIVVLSASFLASVWGKMEFRAAHVRALQERRRRVVVVLYGDLGPADSLDAELRAYLTMNTYVKWGDPWFWRKLQYAMPRQKRGQMQRNISAVAAANVEDKLDRMFAKAEMAKVPAAVHDEALLKKLQLVEGR